MGCWLEKLKEKNKAIELLKKTLPSNDAKSIRLFAGCGIVNGSNPESEYAESQAKLLPMKSTVGRALKIDDEVENFVYVNSRKPTVDEMKYIYASVYVDSLEIEEITE